MTERKIVSRRIEAYRKDVLHMTQEEFGVALGMDKARGRSMVNNWEQGDAQLKSDALYKIGSTFGVSVDYLLGLSDNPTVSEDLKTAIKVTRLSERAIESLKQFAGPGIISKFLEDDDFYEMMYDVLRLRDGISAVAHEMDEIKDSADRQEVPDYGHFALWFPLVQVKRYRVKEQFVELLDKLVPSKGVFSAAEKIYNRLMGEEKDGKH